MSFLGGLATAFTKRIADRIADQVILMIRKRLKYGEIDKEAKDIKSELKLAQSASEREAILDKVHDLVNSIDD